MDQSDTPTRTANHSGWTEPRKLMFLEHLAACGNVRAACSRVGLSHEAAYRQRRRDALFARGWDAALVLARAASAEVLACRAIDGVEEEVWHRGEVVGTRRRYDTRLMLAHMARLDALAANERASEDAARFDQLLACLGGTEPPEDLPVDDDGLPAEREACVEWAGDQAEAELQQEEDEQDKAGEPLEPAALRARSDRAVATWRRARAQAGRRWDAWQALACETVDRLLDQPGGASAARTPSTPSTLSTSPLADGPAHGQPGAPA